MKQQNWTAWKLAGWLASHLRRPLLAYLGSATLFALVTLAPGKLFHYFAAELPAVGNGAEQTTFLNFILTFGVLVVVGTAVGALIKVYFKEKLRLELETFLRYEVLKQLHSLSGSRLKNFQRGEWLTRVSADVRGTEEFLGTTASDILYSTALALGTCIFLAYYSGAIALVLLLGAVISAGLYYGVQRRLNPLLQEMRTLHSSVFQLLLENLEGWRTIRSFNAVSHELRRVSGRLDSIRRKGLEVARLIGGLLCTNEAVTQSLILVCLLAAAWGAFSGRISATDALVYPFYLGQFFFAVRAIMRGLAGVNRYLVHGGRLAKMFEDGALPPSLVVRVPEGPFQLEVNGLSAELGNGVVPLKEVAFSVRSGEIVALTGVSGSGKSTVLDVLAGLKSYDGSVKALCTDGTWEWEGAGTGQTVPVSLCSYVEQRPYLCEGTLRENLLVGRRGISDCALWAALEAVSLADTFSSRGGLDCALSEQGSNLSEGQKYRVGVARALAKSRPFLLLDEPFASLDDESVQVLIRSLRGLRNTGVLVVTHQSPEGFEFCKTFSVMTPALSPLVGCLPDNILRKASAGGYSRVN